MKKLTVVMLCLLMMLGVSAYAESKECEHLDIYIEFETSSAAYTYVDELLHHVTGPITEVMVCIDCGVRTAGEEYEIDEDEMHFYNEAGVCEACGSACVHPETSLYVEQRNIVFTPVDEKVHLMTCDQYEVSGCYLCGLVLDDVLLTEGDSFEVTHSFMDGECVECGAENTCKHENTQAYTYKDYLESVMKDEKQHTNIGNLYEEVYCNDCEELLSTELIETNHEDYEDHQFVSGMCFFCGAENTCEHGNTSVKEDFMVVDFRPKNDFYHTIISEQYEVLICGYCGDEAGRTLVNAEHCVDSIHYFWEGICMECGYEEALSERVRLMCTIINDVNRLESYPGENVIISLPYAEEVLTAEEKTAFDALPLSEQAPVLLSAIGYEDAVQEVIAGGLMVPSDNAAALLTSVSGRAAERTAQLDDFFPVERVSDEGIDMRTIHIKFASTENNGAMTEIHSLTYNSIYSEWFFVMTEAG